MKANLLTILAASTLLVAACTPAPTIGVATNSNGQSQPPLSQNGITQIKNLGITDAKSLFIAGEDTTSTYRTQNYGQSKKLYKLTKDGKALKVTGKDENGKEINTEIEATYVTNLGDDFVFLVARNEGSWLVRRSDGKVAQLDPRPYQPRMTQIEPVQRDKHGNIYYAFAGKLTKVTPQGGDTLTKSELTGALEQTQNELTVDVDGNILAQVYKKDDYDNTTFRLYKANGGVQNLAVQNSWITDHVNSFVGADGKIYSFGIGGDVHGFGLYRVDVSATGEVTKTVVPGSEQQQAPRNGRLQRVGDKVVISDETWVHVFKGMEYTRHDFVGLRKILATASNGTNIYVLGQDNVGDSMIIKVDIASGTQTQLFKDSNYQVLNLSVNSTDELTLGILSMATNAYGLATLDSTGKLTSIESSMPQVQQVLTLQ